jgi:nucleotide-binding universal stress UspA family protein
MRIVLAVDGSPSSVQARDLVASLAWPEGTGVTLVMAYQVPAVVLAEWGGGARWLDDVDAAMRRDADAALSSLAAPLVERGLTVQPRVELGRPADVILAIADEAAADVIVLGSRGRGEIASMLLGSVSSEVAGRASCSVLVVRHPAVTRLLVATDGSPCSANIPEVLGAWGIFSGLPADALSVAPVDSPAFALMVSLYTLGSESPERQREELRVLHEGHARALADALSGIGIPARPIVRLGDAAHEITTAATESGADLVVTGSRCLTGIDRWLLGSVGRNVLLHAHSSVLVVRGQMPA